MIIFSIAIFCLLFWLGFKLTGALLSALFWIFVLLPCAIVLWMLGIACFCTILLIPVGVKLVACGAKVLFP